jgi:uncharacterized protein
MLWSVQEMRIPAGDLSVTASRHGDGGTAVVLGHGAGGDRRTRMLVDLAEALAGSGRQAVLYNFPYSDRGRGAPDPPDVLERTVRAVADHARATLGAGKVVLGGKSMGGRIASLVADEVGARGLVCLGYPFHPPGRPDKLRTKHLEDLKTPALVVQGTRDAFGTPEDVAGYALSPAIRVHWIADGDHSFKPRASSGRTDAANLAEAIAVVREFLESL